MRFCIVLCCFLCFKVKKSAQTQQLTYICANEKNSNNIFFNVFCMP